MHLHPTLVVEPGGTSKAPVLVRYKLSLAREGKLWWKVCLNPHLEQGGTPLMGGSKGAGHHFFPLLQMGATPSSRLISLDCVLKNWVKFDPQSLKKTRLTFFCKSAWPQYLLEGGRQWPVEGSLNYNTVDSLEDKGNG